MLLYSSIFDSDSYIFCTFNLEFNLEYSINFNSDCQDPGRCRFRQQPVSRGQLPVRTWQTQPGIKDFKHEIARTGFLKLMCVTFKTLRCFKREKNFQNKKTTHRLQ